MCLHWFLTRDLEGLSIYCGSELVFCKGFLLTVARFFVLWKGCLITVVMQPVIWKGCVFTLVFNS